MMHQRGVLLYLSHLQIHSHQRAAVCDLAWQQGWPHSWEPHGENYNVCSPCHCLQLYCHQGLKAPCYYHCHCANLRPWQLSSDKYKGYNWWPFLFPFISLSAPQQRLTILKFQNIRYILSITLMYKLGFGLFAGVVGILSDSHEDSPYNAASLSEQSPQLTASPPPFASPHPPSTVWSVVTSDPQEAHSEYIVYFIYPWGIYWVIIIITHYQFIISAIIGDKMHIAGCKSSYTSRHDTLSVSGKECNLSWLVFQPSTPLGVAQKY